MERLEMLNELHTLPTAAELVVLSTEMAIECTYVSNKGYKYEWIALDQWPAILVTFSDEDKFQKIRSLIGEHHLQLSDIENSPLYSVYMDMFSDRDEDLNLLFSGLELINYPQDGKIYLLCLSDTVEFFSEYEQFEAQFYEAYVTDCNPWEDLSDVELEEWLERTRTEFDGIPCSEYTDELPSK